MRWGQAAGRFRLAPKALLGLAWLLAVVLVSLNLLYIGRLGPNDDAYITYRVARNLADGLGPVFNPGERVLSITTPGYALLLAALSPLSRDFVALGLALSGLGLLATAGLLIELSRRPAGQAEPADGLGHGLAALVAVALALTFRLLSEAVGMETPLYVASLLALFAAYGRTLAQPASTAAHRRWLALTAAAGAVAFLLRPDGVLAVAAVAGHYLATQRRAAWPGLALFAAVALAIAAPWVAFAWLYYGSPVPNTLAAKATQGLAEDVPRWGPGLWAAAQAWARSQPAAAALAALGLVVALRGSGTTAAVRRVSVAWAALTIALHSLLGVRSYFWYYAPLMPVVALLAGDGAAWLARRSGRGRRALDVLLALALVAVAAPAGMAAARLAARPEPRQRELAYARTAPALAALCRQPGREPVAMAEIGLLGYLTGCRVVDFSGLLQPELAHLAARPAEKMEWALKRYAPPLVVLAGSEGFPHAVTEPLWFRQRYEPVDIQDERGFLSVIYARGPGAPAQHDLADAAWWQPASPLAGRSLSLAPGRPFTVTLHFPAGVTPTVALHAYIPGGATLSLIPRAASDEGEAGEEGPSEASAPVCGEDQASAPVPGCGEGWQGTFLGADGWRDLALAGLPVGSRLDLVLRAEGIGQPVAVAWVESNALPAVHYFPDFVDLNQRPRPRLRLAPGESRRVELARATGQPRALELLHRDRPGVAVEVWANGRLLATVGGADEWRTEQVPLPEEVGSVVSVELRSQGARPAELVYVALKP
ncbi:MAG: hypothetical protein RMN53_09105 [Anaerolineae bacterium]|nr:hypothetical protein [Anaerolineae bacterium]